MRRIVAIFLICLLPLQLAWATASSMYGHLDDVEVAVGFHIHDHNDEGHHDVNGDSLADHDDGQHHDGHFHHVYSMLVFEVPLSAASSIQQSDLPRLSAAFTSHIPHITDRPPSARQ